jgi:hypothetical protein
VDAYPDELLRDLYAADARLKDLSAMQRAGVRLPGGLSGRIELARLRLMAAREHIFDLIERDPAAAQALLTDINHSRNLAVAHLAETLHTQLSDNSRM